MSRSTRNTFSPASQTASPPWSVGSLDSAPGAPPLSPLSTGSTQWLSVRRPSDPTQAPHMGTVPLPDVAAPSSTPLSVNPAIAYGSCTQFDLGLSVPGVLTVSEPAFSPSVPRVLIRIPGTPTPILVTHPTGQPLTVRRTMHDIWTFLHAPIDGAEFRTWPAQIQAAASVAFRQRASLGGSSDFSQGLRRVDVLGQNVVFAGLSPLADGSLMLCLGLRQ
ncbi:hypothetical protein PUNSTDRAFT_44747 [Punctularia strigosozonata HHB-11173 SS5]|uniref:uncharacterized protein n=1 Tax=Punctularia strigosozonata (strain HHB-11173) TaxID=741275 RepID=UPI0004416F6F|nr:uncharacterized protein PUNSTDRAFT_44747 [Punctularia strigosozonata HHB-11173 SS5]EIN08146.1 hypothetical protein PUNSTDRAFT_44747 [Punctularia strigosozonata HHB-11173 SS5]